jgi:hypothetical protein
MNQNPYQSPGAYAPPVSAIASGAPSRMLFILAGVGAFLASAYWALMTLLLVAGMAAGTVSGTTLVFPVILIVLYAVRGFQILKGDIAATKRIVWLHGVGAVAAVVQMMSGNVIVIGMNVVKVCVHVFGGTMAWLAHRSATRPPGMV